MQFTPCTISEWPGRYARTPGDTTGFHLRADNQIVLYWDRDNERLTLSAFEMGDAAQLAKAVAEGKRFLDGPGSPIGGQFVINEFGQVLVPSAAGDNRRAIVGRIEGTIKFKIPDADDSVIDLSDSADLEAGDLWPYPYVGVPYALQPDGSICFKHRQASERDTPQEQDKKLIESLEKVRGSTGARFIVNPWGLAATKRQLSGPGPSNEQRWEPVYVGRIDYKRWFNMETV